MRCLEFVQGRTLSRGFFDQYSFKQLRRETRGQWQKCVHEYLFYYLLSEEDEMIMFCPAPNP